MDNPGIFDLGSQQISSALTDEVITEGVDSQGITREFIGDLDGMLAAGIEVNFTYGAGGTTCKWMLDTSFDQGSTWVEIARLAFTTSSAKKLVNLSALTPVTTVYAPTSLSDDSVKDGLLGDRLRSRVTTTGTYSGNTSIAGRVVVR